MSRHPGEFSSSDHTFKLSEAALGESGAYAFFLGEEHDICWHGATRTTSWAELLPAMRRGQARFERMQKNGVLKYWYDDRCCDGALASKLHLHPVAMVFRLDRCPRKDSFHSTQNVPANGGAADVGLFKRDIGGR